jgi:3-dehydroquinate dehydratase / shikimate dehydrogenase
MARFNGLPRVCIALGFSDPGRLLECARREVASGEEFLEFRLDYLPDPRKGVEAIRSFLELHPDCAVMATCRRHQNHGRFNGSIDEQLHVLAGAIEAGAKAIDLEIETAEVVPAERLSAFRGETHLVISYHNFSGTPAMEVVLRRMLRIPADAYKLVTTANKPSDNLRVLALAKSHPRVPLVLLAMGEIGFPTRVLSAAYGGMFTYAAPAAAEGTAAGQVCARMLKQFYRIDRLTKTTKAFGVIADPVRHSISPAVHNRAFQARRINAVYLPFLVSGGQLKDLFILADKLPLSGFSVTIPHKQKILRYLDLVDPTTRRIGAANTVWRKGGKWRGTNTDVHGVIEPLSKVMRLPKSTVLLIGNGGAARSAAFALSGAGAQLSIVGRNADRVRALAKASGAEALDRDALPGRHFDALIHATPMGMFPHVNECYFQDAIPADVVFDMVYNPLETVLIKKAKEQGKTVIPGLDMFLEQAARQFEIWTEDSAPRPVMQRAAMESLTTSFCQEQEGMR